jgi:signal transduction histidine kinase
MMGEVVRAPAAATGRVLVADDDAVERRLLRAVLEDEGHQVIEAEDGEAALREVADRQPDALVMDVCMPGPTGVEVCRQLKQDPQTALIPILLMTGHDDHAVRLAGIEAGANDFLAKPINLPELLLRVRNAVHAKQLADALAENYARLQELEKLRDDLTHMIVHDMRSPLAAVGSYLELLRLSAGGRLAAAETEYVDQAHRGTVALLEMVNTILDMSRLETVGLPLKIRHCDPVVLVHEAIGSLGHLVGEGRVLVEKPAQGLQVTCDPELIRRTVANMVGNALRYTPAGSQVRVAVRRDEAGVRVSVVDRGPGIPPEYRERIFEKFGQVENFRRRHRYGTGLGLAFCKLTVEAHGGRIGVDSEVGQGSTFWFVLPAARESWAASPVLGAARRG